VPWMRVATISTDFSRNSTWERAALRASSNGSSSSARRRITSRMARAGTMISTFSGTSWSKVSL
jgi:hypothetical protein